MGSASSENCGRSDHECSAINRARGVGRLVIKHLPALCHEMSVFFGV
jgi:hypothetical protein